MATARKKLGWTQARMALYLQVNAASVKHWERGRAMVPAGLVCHLVKLEKDIARAVAEREGDRIRVMENHRRG